MEIITGGGGKAGKTFRRETPGEFFDNEGAQETSMQKKEKEEGRKAEDSKFPKSKTFGSFPKEGPRMDGIEQGKGNRRGKGGNPGH